MAELISIVIPIYKVEKYLTKCVDSVRKQSYPELEIILVDDGSPDNSGKICDELAAEDERIKVIHKVNGGLSDARNAGLAAATGDYVAFLDSDDFVDEKMFEILLTNLKKNQADISVCDYLEYWEGDVVPASPLDQSIQVVTNEEALEKLFDRSYAAQVQTVIITNKLYRRELFSDDIRFPIGKIHEDEFTTYKLIYKAKKVVYTDAKLLYYLQREDSITGNQFSFNNLHALDAFKERTRFFEEQGLDKLAALSTQHYLNAIIKYYFLVKGELQGEDATLRVLKKCYDDIYKAAKSNYAFSLKNRVRNGLFHFSPKLFQIIK